MSVNMEDVRQRFPTNPGYIDDAGQEQNAGHLRLTRADWDSVLPTRGWYTTPIPAPPIAGMGGFFTLSRASWDCVQPTRGWL